MKVEKVPAYDVKTKTWTTIDRLIPETDADREALETAAAIGKIDTSALSDGPRRRR